MMRIVYKQAETRAGAATVTLERDGGTFVVREVVAQMCPNCGEEYVDSEVAAQLRRSSEDLSRPGVQFDVRPYAAA